MLLRFPQNTLYFLALLGLISFTACSSDDDNDNGENDKTPSAKAITDMRLEADGQNVERGELFSFGNAFDFRLLEVRFYVSNVEFQTTTGDWVSAKPDVLLLDIREQGEDTHMLTEIPVGEYVAMRYLIGLDSATNRVYPTDFPREHPLSAFQATHWNWNLFYRFIIVEGRTNTYGNFIPPGDTSGFNTPLSIHPGTDEMLVEKEQAFPETVRFDKNDSKRIYFTVNVNDWLDGPGGQWDPMIENQGHAEPHDFELTKKFGANFGGSISAHIE